MSTDAGVWVSALLTIAAYSFLWKENRLFRAVEHIFVGLGAGYGIAMGYSNIVSKAWNPITKEGKVYLVIPVIMGVLLFGRFVKSMRWTARIPLAFIVGMGAAIALRGAVEQQFVKQIQATMMPLTRSGTDCCPRHTVRHVLLLLHLSEKPGAHDRVNPGKVDSHGDVRSRVRQRRDGQDLAFHRCSSEPFRGVDPSHQIGGMTLVRLPDKGRQDS